MTLANIYDGDFCPKILIIDDLKDLNCASVLLKVWLII